MSFPVYHGMKSLLRSQIVLDLYTVLCSRSSAVSTTCPEVPLSVQPFKVTGSAIITLRQFSFLGVLRIMVLPH